LQVIEPGSQSSLQQSLSNSHGLPVATPEGPPHVLSHVPHDPLQQSVSSWQVAPSTAPDCPPHVLSHVPQLPGLPEQQSPSIVQA
jgi:hypothetical protein